MELSLVGANYRQSVALRGGPNNADNFSKWFPSSKTHDEKAEFLGIRVLFSKALKRHCDLRGMRWSCRLFRARGVQMPVKLQHALILERFRVPVVESARPSFELGSQI